jgi:glutathione synthase/RimK-type ligase-like ATP-grasp enzyme
MRVLLSDGAGLTARQCATVLSEAGHDVEVLSPDPLCLCRFTGRVRRVHSVPAIGTDPLGWLDAALDVAARRHADMLLPVQEQVAVMSLARERITRAGLQTAVPDFDALAQVQDKVSAFGTLTRLSLPQPPGMVVTSAAGLLAVAEPPLYAKAPIGTASAGVRHVSTSAELRQLAASWAWDTTSMLIQQLVRGPLVMIQSVFAHGELAAFHACMRVREGTGGGASHKLGVALPAARESIRTLGTALGWHGALSADVIVTDSGPLLIDINPRLVEPVNALRSGVDLTATMIQVAQCGSAPAQPAGTPGARTHQLLLAVLGAAQHDGRRRDIVRTLSHALTRTADYRDSTEELTPAWSLPMIAATLATLVSPPAWRHFAGAPRAYSLTPAAWQELLDEKVAGPGDRTTRDDREVVRRPTAW